MIEGAPRLFLTSRFEDAVAYATRIHATQARKSTDTPYLSHLLGVASLVLENGAETEDETIAALLHDAGEGQGAAWQRDLGPYHPVMNTGM